VETPARFLLVEPGDVDHCLVAGFGCTGVLELGRCSVGGGMGGVVCEAVVGNSADDFMAGRPVGERAAGEVNNRA